jgi:hypothetical protein
MAGQMTTSGVWKIISSRKIDRRLRARRKDGVPGNEPRRFR